MDLTIHPHPLAGATCAIASKSLAHRALILAALCPQMTDILCPTSSDDIDATVGCLEARLEPGMKDRLYLRYSRNDLKRNWGVNTALMAILVLSAFLMATGCMVFPPSQGFP